MSIIATAVRHLMAAGVTGDALIAAIEDMEAQIRAEPKPRSSGAIRQERYRENKRNNPSPVTVSDACDAPSPPPPLSPQTPLTPPPPHPDNNTRARKGVVPAKPEGVQDQTWQDFLDLRKRKRAPLTETAMAGIAREAQKAGWTMEAALAKCLARGWQGFEADWVKAEKPPNGEAPEFDPMMRSLLAHRAKKVEARANV